MAPSLDEMMADEDDKSITLRDGDRLGLDELGGLVAMPPATTGAAATGAVAEEDDDDDAVAIAVVRFHGRRFWLHELPLARAAGFGPVVAASLVTAVTRSGGGAPNNRPLKMAVLLGVGTLFCSVPISWACFLALQPPGTA